MFVIRHVPCIRHSSFSLPYINGLVVIQRRPSNSIKMNDSFGGGMSDNCGMSGSCGMSDPGGTSGHCAMTDNCGMSGHYATNNQADDGFVRQHHGDAMVFHHNHHPCTAAGTGQSAVTTHGHFNSGVGLSRTQRYRSCCGICLIIFGIFFCVPGIALTAQGNSASFDNPFFDSSNRTKRVLGAVLLSLGLFMLVSGIVTMVVFNLYRKERRSTRNPQVNQPVVTGVPPPHVVGSIQTTAPGGQQGYPTHQPYPGQVHVESHPAYPSGHEWNRPSQATPYPGCQPSAPPNEYTTKDAKSPPPPSYDEAITK